MLSMAETVLSQPLRVAVVARQSLVRSMFAVALENEAGFAKPEQVPSLDQLMERFRFNRPDVALVEAELFDGDWAGMLAKVERKLPGCAVLAFGGGGRPDWLVDGVVAGLGGYITRDASLVQLVAALRVVAQGELALPRRLVRDLMRELVRSRQTHEDATACLGRLTPQEQRVLGLLAGGASNVAIATDLAISPQTARTHVQNILGKLDVHSRLEAMAYVLQNPVLGSLLRPS